MTHYRPDVDGLRTIAVVPVVLFHAGSSVLSGGYVGVDVFFVISGFLITGIIANELQRGRFSLLDFYRRRARRIFPALTLVVLATLATGYLILSPNELKSVGESAASIALFASNFYFWKSVNYFDPGIQPLLHTWSLAVEEQYYLLFPLMLMALHRRRRLMSIGLWAVFAGSLALSIVAVWQTPGAAFYLLPSRAWEMMIGGLLALGHFGEPKNPASAKAASLAGLVLIFVPMFVYTHSTPFPGIAAIPCVLGTVLVIWGRGWGLSSAPMVWIGKRSYSLYLWHLPVIEFAKYLTDAPLSFGAGLALSALSLGLAHLTFEYVEQPFRKGRPSAAVAAAGMPVMAAVALALVALGGMSSRLSPLQARQLDTMNDGQRHPAQCMTLDTTWVDPGRPCTFGVAPKVLLWGDSHAVVTATSMIAAQVPFHFAAAADCPIGAGLAISSEYEPRLTLQGHYRRCGEYNAQMLARALRPDVETVVLSARWTNWRIGELANPAEDSVDVRLVDDAGVARSAAGNRIKFERAFTSLVDVLTRAGKTVVIVGPVPEPDFNVPHRLYVSGFGFAPAPTDADYARRHRVILSYFKSLESIPGVTFVWPSQLLCAPRCASLRDGMPVYFDHNHLTVAAARRLAPLYAGLARED